MEKIYRVQMNRNGAPDFSTAVECEDAVSRTWLKNYCEGKAAHYRMRKERIEEQGDAITYYPEKQIEGFKDEIALYEWLAKEIDKAPSADRPTVDKDYLIRLIQEAVYDGEACAKLLDLVDRPQGEWIDAEISLESGGSMSIQACNLCKTFYPLAYTGGGHRFCPNCGADMRRGVDDGTN